MFNSNGSDGMTSPGLVTRSHDRQVSDKLSGKSSIHRNVELDKVGVIVTGFVQTIKQHAISQKTWKNCPSLEHISS